MKKTTIYWFHSHFLLSTGGTRFVFEVVKQLQKKYQVEIIVEKSTSEWVEKYRKLGVPIHQIAPITSTTPLYWLILPIVLIWNYWQISHIVPRNAIIISTMFPFHFLANSKSRNTVYYCFEPFAFFYDRDLIRSFSPLKQTLLRCLSAVYSPLDKFAVQQTNQLVTINPSVGKYVQQIYQRAVDGESYLGVDTHFFRPDVKPLFKKQPGQTVLFHSTDYTTLKGTWYVLQAVAKLPKTVHWKLFISETMENINEKSLYERFITENNLQSNIEFLGHISYAQLPRVYASCDVYCFTGSPESQGATMASLSVLEASASELAVIRTIGNTDEVIDGKTGMIVDPRNTSQLVTAIIQLATQPATRKKMGRAGRAHVLSQYQWNLVANRMSSHIEKLDNH